MKRIPMTAGEYEAVHQNRMAHWRQEWNQSVQEAIGGLEGAIERLQAVLGEVRRIKDDPQVIGDQGFVVQQERATLDQVESALYAANSAQIGIDELTPEEQKIVPERATCQPLADV